MCFVVVVVCMVIDTFNNWCCGLYQNPGEMSGRGGVLAYFCSCFACDSGVGRCAALTGFSAFDIFAVRVAFFIAAPVAVSTLAMASAVVQL